MREGEGRRLGALVRGSFEAAVALGLLLASTGEAHPVAGIEAVAIQPLVDPAPSPMAGGAGSLDPLTDGGPLIAHLVLSVTPGIEVRWRPVDPGGQETLPLFPPTAVPPPPGAEPGGEAADAASPSPHIRTAKAMLDTLPRTLRKRSLKKLAALGLPLLDEREAEALVGILALRAAGDPARAASALEAEIPRSSRPLLHYLLAASRLEAEDLPGAAGAIAAGGAGLEELPGPMLSMGRAIVDAHAGERQRAMGRLTSIVESQPSIAEASLLRARLARRWCDLYDQPEIIADLDRAVRSSPCCPTCALDLAEMLAFTDRPEVAPSRIRSEAGCRQEPLDSARPRALALAFAASESTKESLEAAAVAEANDVSALRRGLAPAFLLAGDYRHLEESYDPESDLAAGGAASFEQQLHSGLNALWRGRPSRAAELFDRAEEKLVAALDGPEDRSADLQLVRTLKIRSFLTAGRIEEARRASVRARETGRGNMNGLLIFSAALSDLAAGDIREAVSTTRGLTLAGLKFWRYLLDAEVALQQGDAPGAQSALSLASQGVDVQTTVCPGVSIEPYMLQAQGKALIALGRHDAAARLLERLVASGSRGLLAPEIVVPSWGLLARAREALGDRQGALTAWEELLGRWGAGEEFPAVEEARREVQRLGGGG